MPKKAVFENPNNNPRVRIGPVNLVYDHSQKGGFQITLIVLLCNKNILRLIRVIVSHNKILVVYRNSERKGSKLARSWRLRRLCSRLYAKLALLSRSS
jgi:hypothetical protein